MNLSKVISILILLQVCLTDDWKACQHDYMQWLCNPSRFKQSKLSQITTTRTRLINNPHYKQDYM